MNKKRTAFHKAISLVTGFFLIFQSLVPGFSAFAQEVTPTPTEEVTVTPTPEETVVSPTPTEEVTPEPTATPTPTEEITPTPTPTEEIPTPTTTQPPQETSPPQETQGEILDGVTTTATPEPTPTIRVEEPAEQGHLAASVIENVNAQSLDLDSVDASSATLTTDKADYAPTDTALISGTGFLPNRDYKLTISSSDEPATSTTVDIKTDENGTFVYAYQLDGIYRPNYKVAVKNLNDETITETTFTDSHIASHECTNDLQGVNDEPGQKDLTKMCVNETGIPNSIQADWNWDDTGWSGANTGDACALFDTDGDGLANFASCVTVENDPATQKSTSPRIFTCNDTRVDRCAGPTLITGPYTSSCSVSITSDQPFGTGDDTPNDTHAACTVQMSEVGGAGVADLIDVCSFPSDNPNSDPSDCIIFEPGTGRLEVIKDLIPSTDAGLFNLQINGTTEAANVGDAGSTGEKIYEVANNGTVFTVGETAGTGTNLSSYSTSIECRGTNGTGSIVASSSNSGPLNVTLNEDDDIVCTITNTLLLGSLAVHKDVQGPNGEAVTDVSQNFTVQLDGANSQTITDGGTVTYSDVLAGSHAVTETVIPSGYSLYSITPEQATVVAGQTTDVYVVNRQQNATVTIHKNVVDPEGNDVSDAQEFTVQKNAGSDDTIAEGNDAVYSVAPGVYTFTELAQANYTLYSITGDNDANAGNGATITVVPGGSYELTFVNKQDAGSISGYKYVDADGNLQTEGDRSPVEGLLVELWKWVTDTFVDTGMTDTTDSNGFYSFLDLVPGVYQVREVLSSLTGNWTSLTGTESDSIVVDPGETEEDHNFVNFEILPGVSAIKSLTSSQVALEGDTVTFQVVVENTGNVTLYNPVITDTYDDDFLQYVSSSPVSEATHSIAVTDASDYDGDGNTTELIRTLTWNIPDLAPGDTYTLTITFTAIQFTVDNPETTYAGNEIFTQSCLSDGEGCPREDVILTDPSAAVVDIDALGSVSGTKFVDADGDGQWADEGTLGGVTINLYNDEEQLLATTVTAQDGTYGFTNLSTGDYVVCEEVPTGYVQTYPIGCHEFSVTDDGETIENKNFGNQGQGTIIVEKVVEGTVTEEEFSFTISDGDELIETIGFVLGDGDSTNPDYSGLPANTYVVSEEPNELYTTSVECVSDQEDEESADSLNLDPGETITCTFTNTRKTGGILIHKIIDADGDLKSVDDQTDGEGWYFAFQGTSEDTSTLPTDPTNADGLLNFENVKTGTYDVEENLQPGYDLISNTCDEGLTVISGETAECTFINSPNGQIHGFKWNDENGNGEFDEGEVRMGGWTIFLDKNENSALDEGEQSTETLGEGQDFGWYMFTHLFPGTYRICEVNQLGWAQTSSPICYEVELPFEGEQTRNGIFAPEFDFGNQLQNPILTISKLNNASGDKAPGDNVLYTITVTATQSAAYNVKVTDLLPDGFKYRLGSWTANSTLRGDLKGLGITTEPTYASPGVWQLGDMAVNEVVTLTYLADISGDQKPGLYKDLAWAMACKFETDCSVGDGNDVLSLAIDPGFLDTNFVGTKVNVVKDLQNSSSINLQGEVLGASTELPATGANNIWLYVALILFISGSGMVIVGRRYE